MLQPFSHSVAQAKLKLIAVSAQGADAAAFVAGQSTQELSAHWRQHCFLDRGGRIEVSFLARTEGKDVSMLVSEDGVASLCQRFERFVVSEDVGLSSPHAVDVFFAAGLPRPPGMALELGDQRLWLEFSAFPGIELRQALELKAWLRWQGLHAPDSQGHCGDLINQTPFMVSGVSLKKGCFPGQETVAKVHNNRGAAWAPMMLQRMSGEVLPRLQIQGKDVAVLELGQSDGAHFHAQVLRDVRVHDLAITADNGSQWVVRAYPRFPVGSRDLATELFHIGTDAFRDGDEDLALHAWELAISADEGFADAYEAIGVLLGRQEKFSEAEAWMRRLLEVDASSVMAHTNLSLFLMRQNRIQEAEDHKAKATVASFAMFGRKAQEDKRALEEASRREAERAKRESMFRQVLDIDPEDTLAHFGLGELCLERRLFREAREHLETVLAHDANYTVAYLALGKALLELGEKPMAQKVFQTGIAVAAKRGDLMPANEMQSLLSQLGPTS